MKCRCGADIPAIRLEILPDTTTCAACSTESARKAYMVFSHKTAPDLVVVPDNPEAERIAKRAFQRAR